MEEIAAIKRSRRHFPIEIGKWKVKRKEIEELVKESKDESNRSHSELNL